MIPISEVLEEAAQIIDQQDVDPAFKHRMSSHIRALAAQYEGCIVAEGEPDCYISTEDGWPRWGDGANRFPLYRAKEPE
jgi:hypothetical protein